MFHLINVPLKEFNYLNLKTIKIMVEDFYKYLLKLDLMF